MLGIFGTSEFEKIVSREITLTNQRRAAIEQISKAKELAGTAMVDGDAATEVGAVSRLATEIESMELAIALLRERRPIAIAAEDRREAEELRARQAAKQKELAAHSARVSKLLSQLSELEGVQLSGEWMSIEGGVTRSEKLTIEIRALDQKATELSASAPKYGYVDLDGVTGDEQVIEAVLRHKSAGPSGEAVLQWLSKCAASNRVPDRSFGAQPRRVRVEWNDGVIDNAASYVYVRSLAPRRESTAAAPFDGYDTDAATFRAAA